MSFTFCLNFKRPVNQMCSDVRWCSSGFYTRSSPVWILSWYNYTYMQMMFNYISQLVMGVRYWSWRGIKCFWWYGMVRFDWWESETWCSHWWNKWRIICSDVHHKDRIMGSFLTDTSVIKTMFLMNIYLQPNHIVTRVKCHINIQSTPPR